MSVLESNPYAPDAPDVIDSSETIGHECGLSGVVLDSPHAVINTMMVASINALAHRGQTSAGMATINEDGKLQVNKGLGSVSQVFTDDRIHALPIGSAAFSHTRYPTKGPPELKNAHPYLFSGPFHSSAMQSFALGQNGNISSFEVPIDPDEPTSDTYKVGKMIAQGSGDFVRNVTDALPELNGAYQLVFLTEDGRLFIASDPHSMRPMHGGRVQIDGITGMVIASETIGVKKAGAVPFWRMPRGAFVEVHPTGFETLWTDPRTSEYGKARCTFEEGYFADATSDADAYENRTNHEVRSQLGARLVSRVQPNIDMVCPVPRSGFSYAEGAAGALGKPFIQAVQILRNTPRNFIQPHTPEERKAAAKQKFDFIPGLIRGKRIGLFDDSVVRGFTTQGLTLTLLELGAAGIHWLIGVPVIKERCFWGLDFAELNELIYHQLMNGGGQESFEKRLAFWLVGGNEELAQRVQISFQQLDDYVEIVRNVPYGTPIDQCGGCVFCHTGIPREGLIVDFNARRTTV